MIKTLNGIDDKQLLDELFNSDIVVYEDIQGSKIWVNFDNGHFSIRTKSLNSDNINLVDIALQRYYNFAIKYFLSLDKRVYSMLNKNWWFCFEYFPDEKPANIEYTRIPKNNLILTCINKKGKYTSDIQELNEYANLIGTDVIPVIYEGRLTDKMKEGITYFLNTEEEDLEYVFGDKNFSFFFYKILNPLSTNSFLSDEFNDNTEKIILKLKDKEMTFQILNPLYVRNSHNNSTDFVETYTLLLFSFLNFLQSIDLKTIELKGETKDKVYIYFISQLYNLYMSEASEDIDNFEFIVPKFFNKDKFRINKELIKNEMTLSLIEENPKYEYLYKVLLGSFNKKKKKTIGIFNENTLEFFNKCVDDISNSIEFFLNRSTEEILRQKGLVDFGDYFNIKYSTDGKGEVYIDVFDEFEKKEKDGGGKKKKVK